MGGADDSRAGADSPSSAQRSLKREDNQWSRGMRSSWREETGARARIALLTRDDYRQHPLPATH